MRSMRKASEASSSAMALTMTCALLVFGRVRIEIASHSVWAGRSKAYIRLRNQVKLDVPPEADNRWVRLFTLRASPVLFEA